MISLEKIGLIALSHGWEREGTRCTRSQQVKWDDGEGELSGGWAGVLVVTLINERRMAWILNCCMEVEV